MMPTNDNRMELIVVDLRKYWIAFISLNTTRVNEINKIKIIVLNKSCNPKQILSDWIREKVAIRKYSKRPQKIFRLMKKWFAPCVDTKKDVNMYSIKPMNDIRKNLRLRTGSAVFVV